MSWSGDGAQSRTHTLAHTYTHICVRATYCFVPRLAAVVGAHVCVCVCSGTPNPDDVCVGVFVCSSVLASLLAIHPLEIRTLLQPGCEAARAFVCCSLPLRCPRRASRCLSDDNPCDISRTPLLFGRFISDCQFGFLARQRRRRHRRRHRHRHRLRRRRPSNHPISDTKRLTLLCRERAHTCTTAHPHLATKTLGSLRNMYKL